MFKHLITITLVFGVAFIAAPVSADWDPGEPAKWVQLPDLSPQGMDVNASLTDPIGAVGPLLVLADDFECTSTDPITDIHIWGSWLNDVLPEVFDPNSPTFFSPDAGSVQFHLSIRADIPANSGVDPRPYSRPGALLWDRVFDPGEFAVRSYARDIEEAWYDPVTNDFIFPGDTEAWQYNFLIPEADAFVQQGTTTQPVVYWLDVAAIPQNQGPTPIEPLFGWKTSVDRWNDAAVYGPVGLANWPNPPEWYMIEDVQGIGETNMAFVITPEPASLALMGLAGLAVLRRS